MLTGSLQEKRGIYQCVLNFKNENGKRKQKWISTGLPIKGNKRKAEKILQDLIIKYSTFDFSKKICDIKFTDYAERWLENKREKIEQSTWDTYYNSLKNHIIPYFSPLGLNINDIKPKHIKDYYDYKFNQGRKDKKSGGLSYRTIKDHKTALNAVLNCAVVDEIIIKNPVKGILIPKRKDDDCNKGEHIFLSAAQANKLLQLFENHRLKTLVYITLYYGLRRSEILGLKWDAVDFKNSKISIKHTVVKSLTVVTKNRTKTETSQRAFKMCPKVEELLKEVKRQQEKNKKLFGNEYIMNDYVFTWENGKLYHPDYITKSFQKVLAGTEFKKMRFHDLRHSCASILYDMKLGLKDIQKWLGHADIETTGNIYTHISKTREAMVADEMENTLVLNF